MCNINAYVLSITCCFIIASRPIKIGNALYIIKSQRNPDCENVKAEELAVQTPPNPEMGDLGIPMFVFAKSARIAPPQISAEVAKRSTDSSIGEILAVGPYVNLKMNKSNEGFSILEKISCQKDEYGSYNSENKKPLEGRRVMVEFSSPNTNKPLHLGHLRKSWISFFSKPNWKVSAECASSESSVT